VKKIIVSTAQNIDAPAEQQGAGMIDAYQAVLAARSYRGSTKHAKGNSILKSATQLNAVGQEGATEHFSETLTNDGSARQTIGLTSRTLSAYKPVVSKALSLTAAAGYGAEVTFNVPAGRARLNASVALPAGVNLSLFAPNGKLAEYNLPQGDGNYGNAQVADPARGTWTALIEGIPSASTPSTVTAKFEASTATWQSFGTLSKKSLTLAPGASGTVTLAVGTPSQPGDQAGSILVHSSTTSPGFASVSSIPVTLRALVPAPNPSTTFTGTLTGGNGRASSTGQTAYYQVQVPSGLPALNVQVSTQNSSNTFFAELVDPTTGEAASAAFNGLGSTLTPEDGAQLHVLNPAAGLWTLVIDFFNTVSGTAVSQPVTVTMNDTPVSASVTSTLPSGSTLTAGTPVTVDVKVTNNGTSPEAYFVDGRLNGQVSTPLAAQNTSTLKLPNLNGTVPTYLVPSQTTALNSTVSSTKPLFFDMNYNFGDPDVYSTKVGTTATASLSSASIADGDWTITPVLAGPTGKTAAASVTASTSMTATTAPFDPTVSSPTGDLWLGSVNASNTFTPTVVNPGQSVTIPVTITPAGASGTKVTGTLYLDDSSVVPNIVTFNALSTNGPEGSEVAAFPYSYTIK
jgi:hypothetical protein